jgi:hypothetical protein
MLRNIFKRFFQKLLTRKEMFGIVVLSVKLKTKKPMIVTQKPNNVVSSGIQNAVSFGIKQEGLAHIFSVLRNQLYSDKILAVIREYACNAVDAHTEAGKPNLPIQITLPSRFNSIFKVRDFGLGLSEQDIQDIYAFYGESTKRKSNAMIGQLGLGSKSAFAYGDNFVIASFVEGVKTTYNAFIDPSQIGQIAKLASEKTKEENGVEISIPVKDHDILSFHTKALNLFKYFKIKPLVNGAPFVYETSTPIINGVDWRIFKESSCSVAIMGNIGYPIDNHFSEDSDITNALNCGIEIDFNIGDLEISASREKLQFTDRTKKTIKDKLTRITSEIATELNGKFKNCATMFDAYKLYGEVFDMGNNLYRLRNLVKNNIVFNGQKITSSRINFNCPTDGSYNVRAYEKTWRNKKIRSYEYQSTECNNKTMLIDNDLNVCSGIINRVHTLVDTDKKVFVLSYRTPADKAAFLLKSGLVDSNFTKLSSLPKISLATAGGSLAPKNTKHSSKEFSFDFDFASRTKNWHRKYSDFWKSEDVDVANDAGLYVIIEKFEFKNQNGMFVSPSDILNLANNMKLFGINISKVYGFKMKHEEALKKNKNMINLFDYINAEMTNYFNKNKISQKIADRLEYDNWNCDWMKFIQNNKSKVSSNTVFAKYAEIFDAMEHKKDKTILDAAVLQKNFFKSVPPTHKLEDIIKNFYKTYPLSNYMSVFTNDSSRKADAIIQYVNLIDG